MHFFDFGHPSYDQLSEFKDATTSPAQAKVAAHLARCEKCRRAVRALRSAQASLRNDSIALPQTLRDRVLSSRREGARIILPTSEPAPRAASRLVFVAAAAAVVIVAVFAEGMFSSTQLADAGATAGSMTITPAMPRPGDVVRVTYKAPAILAKSDSLVLRARLRTNESQPYQGGVPVQSIGVLVRGKSDVYTASFTLPDSVVFAALAVENRDGTVIDDHEKRTWEILTTLDGRNPAFAALDQRANDMMGRSFEEGHASAKRMAALYPDSLGGWSYLHSFESWMGIGKADTVLAKHRAVLAEFDRRWRREAVVPGELLGRLFWYSRSIDTATSRYWRERMLREAPATSFALQDRIGTGHGKIFADHDTAAMLRMLDTLWEQRTFDRATQIASYGINFAVAYGRRPIVEQWWSRMESAVSDRVSAEMAFAEQLTRSPAFADDGMNRLRRLLPVLDDTATVSRYLTETNSRRDARVATRRRRVLTALGRALVASGNSRAGIDTLRLADRTGWDLALARSIRTAAFATNDSATVWSMNARLAVDPSTTDATRDSIDAAARAALGDARWGTLRQTAARLFSQRMLEESETRSVSASAKVRDVQGRTRTLKELGAGRVTVVAFWSPSCGWALDDLDNLADVARRLERVGSQMVVIIDGETSVSPETTKLFAEHNVSVAPYFDVDQSTSKAVNNWGTPQYYVLDESGRLRFQAVDQARIAHSRAEAVRLANKNATAAQQ